MDFREAIAKNNKRTKLVIVSFITLMLCVGLLADVAINPAYPESLKHSFIALLKLQALPFVTIIITSISIIGVFIVSKFGHKIMLSGKEFKELKREGSLSHDEKIVLNIVEEMAISAGLNYKPKAYIMETDTVNAFAAGWNSKNAVIAVTRGLMEKLNRAELQAVIAHETGHIIHGDSKLTLYIGILANVIVTFTNIFAHIAFFMRNGNNPAANQARLLIIVLNLILPIITQVLYLYLSRKREYMADAAAVQLTGDNQAMISALKKISGQHESDNNEEKYVKSVTEHYRSAAYIYSKGDSIFSTHPSIENRLKELGDTL
jgi:heat shock protein HtpX